ncbi:Lysine-specific demethylase 4E [Trichinella murrelli]|uniref:[histone H3]-trimethyl-L-lysine(9) demethylase n=1 Tax=Trichinella murrelli TaxID=144512 RepID=A0A0V0TCR7_9BILA|nr:Lysine-specific demethylase 4E [Trichinella murrelli]
MMWFFGYQYPENHKALLISLAMEFTLSPSEEEFVNFPDYIATIDNNMWKEHGYVKVVAPEKWRKSIVYDKTAIDNMTLEKINTQVLSGKKGVYNLENIQKDGTMSVMQFEKSVAPHNRKVLLKPNMDTVKSYEKMFWDKVTKGNLMYATDKLCSLFDENTNLWNISKLGTFLDKIVSFNGVTKPYLYFGMMKSMFAWHTEDMDLPSINYLHYGYPKFWYVIPSAYKNDFDWLVSQYFPATALECDGFMRHKNIIFSHSKISSAGIPVRQVVQLPGEFILTYPGAYHSGFNLGYNCAEAVNFAMKSWIDYSLKVKFCLCGHSTVRFDMVTVLDKLYRSGEINLEEMEKYYFENKSTLHPGNSKLVPYLKSTEPAVEKMETDSEDYCVICRFFINGEQFFLQGRIPRDGTCVLSALHFGDSVDVTKKLDKLLCCSRCHVRVHARCYRCTDLSDDSDLAGWLCDVCKYQKEKVVCNLCGTSDSALLEYKKNKFCHVQCALLSQNVRFVCPSLHGGKKMIFQKGPLRGRCDYCDENKGTLIRCSEENCNAIFHLHCGRRLGVKYEVADFLTNSKGIHITCEAHSTKFESYVNRRVIVEMSHDHKEMGYVEDEYESILYLVDFEDGCYSDVLDDDIVSCDCPNRNEKDHIHGVGARVVLNWIDGKSYRVILRKASNEMCYSVMLEKTNSVIHVTRSDFTLAPE